MANWQGLFNSMSERNSYLLESGYMSDCSFSVGFFNRQRELIKAHTFLLSSVSPVFESMFKESTPESKEKAISIDMQPDNFKIFLKYIYTEEISFDSIEEAQTIYHAAKKYQIDSLKKCCIEFISNNLTFAYVCEILEFAYFDEESQLKETCLKFIIKNTSEVLKTLKFYQSSVDTFELILSQDGLNISSELELFKALQYYIRIRCTEEELKILEQALPSPLDEESSKNKTEGLQIYKGIFTQAECFSNVKRLAKKIRFLTLSPTEFVNNVVLSKLLTKDEAFSILVCLIEPNMIKTHFPRKFSLSTEKRSTNWDSKPIKLELTFFTPIGS